MVDTAHVVAQSSDGFLWAAMNQLDRKMFRDLWRVKGQAVAISLVIGSGIAIFVMSMSTLYSLEQTRETYYDRSQFADVFASLKRAPNALRDRIAEIPGVARVQTRVVADVTLDVPGLLEPAVGRLISVSEEYGPTLNALHIRSGRNIESDRPGEVLVNESFADAHGLQPGDSVSAVINGRWQALEIVGIALSPEYILQIREGDIWPDEKRFGVFWMSQRQLASAYNMEGAFNDVTLTVMHGASLQEVIQRLDQLTERYGCIGAYDRSEQLSHRYLHYEIIGLRGMALISPSIFLSVAAFLLSVVIARIVAIQREQIAALKAFGYTNLEVGMHYLKFVLLITCSGVLIGTLAGVWLGWQMTQIYVEFYRFPMFHFQFDFRLALLAVTIGVAASLLGTIRAVRKAVKLPPAEALRPEPPAAYHPTFVERTGFGGWLSPVNRMIVRRLRRQPLKSLLSCLGIALALAALVLGNFIEDALMGLIDLQFGDSQREDMMLTFIEPTSGRIVRDLSHLPGVIRCETFRSVPVRIRFRHRSKRLAIMGLPPNRELFRLVDSQRGIIDLPPEGIVISEKLAELLGIELGKTIQVEVLEGARPIRQVMVTGLIADYAGLNAYMDIATVHRLMREEDAVSGAFLQVDHQHQPALFQQLKVTPRVSGVTVKEAAVESFRRSIGNNLQPMTISNIIFASIIAFGVVYNTARVSLYERSRELATLRVLGFTRGEVSRILLGELAILTLAAIPLGMVIGYGFSAFTASSFDFDVYRIPLIVSRNTFALATAVTLVASGVSALAVRSRLNRLDLIAVLKGRE